jgi:hypothetical protein
VGRFILDGLTVALLYVAPPDEPISTGGRLDPAAVHQGPAGTVYLVHLDRPFIRGRLVVRHYLGWSSQGHLTDRQIAHRTGQGSRFLRMAMQDGCTWHLARVWEDASPRRERQLKIQGGASRLCPSCGVIPRDIRQLYRGPDGRYLEPPKGLAS